MADNLLFEVSNSTELDGEPFTRRERIYIIDAKDKHRDLCAEASTK